MSHSHVSNLMHCTFSTKERYPFLTGAGVTAVALPWRYCKREPNESPRDRRHRRSRTRIVIASGSNEFCKGSSANEGWIVKMGARHVPDNAEVSMAGRLWRV